MPKTEAVPHSLAVRLAEDLPDQKGFRWNREKWEAVVRDVPDAKQVLNSLPSILDRTIIRSIVQDNLGRERVLGALVPVLIWGGPSGYGPFRARSILTGDRSKSNLEATVEDSIRDYLVQGANIVRTKGAADAFYFMNNEGHIKYLGGAFFTKWLAFSSMTASTDGEGVAPIFDKRVRDWIVGNADPQDHGGLRTDRTNGYKAYLSLLDRWGGPFGRTRAQVELSIFELTRDRMFSE